MRRPTILESRTVIRLLVSAIAVLAVNAPRHAWASSATVAVAQPRSAGIKTAPATRAALLNEATLHADVMGDLRVVDDPNLRSVLHNCRNRRCELNAAQQAGADRLLVLRVTKSLLPPCSTEASLVDTNDGTTIMTAKVGTGCNDTDLRNATANVTCDLILEYRGAASAPASRATQGVVAAARQAFDRAVCRVLGLSRRKITGPVTSLLSQETKLAADVTDVERQIGMVATHRIPMWTVSAVCLSSELDQHVARIIEQGYRKAPVPQAVVRLGAAARQIYDHQLDLKARERAQRWLDSARSSDRKCIQDARKANVMTSYVARAYQRLHAVDPNRYP